MSIWEKPISHSELLKRAWKHIELGIRQRKHPFHTPVFATVNGDFPSVRTVILRRFWRNPPRLAFHTHIGSKKIAEIESNPRVSWHFYHPEGKIQLRVTGAATIHKDDDLADEQWQATEPFGRRCYLGAAPSSLSKKPTHGMPNDFVSREPTIAESEYGRNNFCVISTSIEHVDFLELDFRGHRRSYFDWKAGADMETGWLTP